MKHGAWARWAWPVVAAVGVGGACSSPAKEQLPGGGSNGGSSGSSGAQGGASGSSGNSGNSGNSGTFGSGGLLDLDSGVGGSQGGSSGRGDSACGIGVYAGEEVPLDMYIMYDKSGSMQDQYSGVSLWDATKDAFIQFVNAPESAGIGVGLQFFPLNVAACGPTPGCAGCSSFFGLFCINTTGGSCDPNDYLPPAVTIQLLPGVAQQITDAINGMSPGGGTPTLPAMQSALQATRAYAPTVAGRKVIIVLATDGEPNNCNSTVNGVAQVAADGYNGTPSIQTFVVGIGNIAGLNQIAQAGGTGQALIVNPATAAADFLNAMNEIRGRALACNFQVPTPPAGEVFQPDQLNVYFTPPNAPEEVVYWVPDVNGCDPTRGGWYYNGTQTEILTCPVTCDRLTVQRGVVSIELGCNSIPIPQ